MSVFRFILLALTAFRLQRVVTADEWPPSQAFRRYIDKRFGENSSWAELFSCAWCSGFWVCVAVFVIEHFTHIPDVVVYIGAASAVVGYLGTYDD